MELDIAIAAETAKNRVENFILLSSIPSRALGKMKGGTVTDIYKCV